PSFRGIQEVYFGQHQALTKVRLPTDLANTQYLIHPAFLDACLHAYPVVLDDPGSAESNCDASYLPISLQGFRCYQDKIEDAWVHTMLRGVEKDGTQIVDIRVYDLAEQPVAELEGLSVRLLPLDEVQSPQTASDDLLYRVRWQKCATPDAKTKENREPASWLIFADSKTDVGAALARQLEASGHHCHLVHRGDTFAQLGPRQWTANERRSKDFPRLLEQFAVAETLPCNGVIYMWGLDAPAMEGLTLASLQSGSEMMERGALAVLHALAETRTAHLAKVRLWFITANTQNTDGHSQHIDPVQAPLWGLGRTAALESPGIWGGLIDLQLNDDRTPDIALLAKQLLAPRGETQIAIFAGQCYVPRFIKQPFAELPTRIPEVRSDATYLITGGLGMLGRSVAKWLIGKGAKHLVLTGRNATSRIAQDLFSAAEVNNAEIRVVAADISTEEDVRRLMHTISDQLPPLRGVVHSAGVLDDGILAQLDWNRFQHLFEPKVYGSWLLHEHTKSLELDFFVLKSSLLSLLGSAGQGNYTASSAFLDSLAAYRRALGLPATSINWCAWSEGGLATVSGARGEAMWSSLGVKSVSTDLAMRMFDKLMRTDVEQIAVAEADWPTYFGKVGKPKFLMELLDEKAGPGSLEPVQQKTIPEPSPGAVSDEDRLEFLGVLQQHVMAELGFEDEIDPDQPLNDVGLDSLMSVNLANSLEDKFGIPVSVAELIKGPTINQLVDEVFCELIGDQPPIRNEAPQTSRPAAMPAATVGEPVIRGPVENGQNWFEVPIGEISVAPQRDARSPAPQPVPVSETTIALPECSEIASSVPAAFNGQERISFQKTLQQHVMAELGFEDEIDPDQPLNDVGLDSLMSVNLANSLEDKFGIPVSVAELIKGPTINQLTDHLFEQLTGNNLSDRAETGSSMAPVEAVKPAVASTPAPHDQINSQVAHGARVAGCAVVAEIQASGDERLSSLELQQVIHNQPPCGPVVQSVRNESELGVHPYTGLNQAESSGNSAGNGVAAEVFDVPVDGPCAPDAPGTVGKWLIAPRPNPNAKVRLFCFPYAGGGLVSFRAWPKYLDDCVEVVAIEPPGRGTRIKETAVDDLETFVECLLCELPKWLDRPCAFFGHCLGGLTMFATLCALPEMYASFIRHAYACGVRPPHLLGRRSAFEDNLAYDMLLHRDFDMNVPPHAQPDEVFADIIRHFDTPAADKMLEIPRLRELLLPTVRAEFGMACNYEYQPVEPFSFPVSSFVGDVDPWVSADDSAGWGEFTLGGFVNHVREGSHFLMADDREFILETINKQLLSLAAHSDRAEAI
ncbi:MAG: SDR family NAD(P)-dependent oxidoreductase, partial [Anderseniella sp.]